MDLLRQDGHVLSRGVATGMYQSQKSGEEPPPDSLVGKLATRRGDGWRWLGLGNSWALRHRGFNKAVLFEDFEASSPFWIHLVAGFNQMRLLDIKLGAETSAPRPVDDARRGP